MRIHPGDIFCPLIDEAFPALRHRGWHDAESSACYTYFSGMSDTDFSKLAAFLEFLESGIVLTPSTHLSPYFSSEIDHCIALDWTYSKNRRETKTPIYQLVSDIKYNREFSRKDKRNAVDRLAEFLVHAVRVHPILNESQIVCAVPARSGDRFSLPGSLAEIVSRECGKSSGAIMAPSRATQKLKDLPIERKHKELSHSFEVTGEVHGQDILLIDDVYESGMTIWSVAQKLKESGARAVYGLACVKTWRDTDNL
jgi:predicted amidophosphoribosyltransferase